MAIQLQLRRGNANAHASFIGAIGEITYNTTNNTIHAHDGNLLGGYEVALKTDLANLIVAPDLSANTTNDLPEGNANLYFTNTRAIGALTGGDNITIEANGLVVGAAGGVTSVNGANGAVTLSTANIAEESNLYFTNARALAAVLDNINTSNVAEGANLYFTNTRAIGALTAGSGVTIEANGMLISTAVSNTGGTVTSVGIIAGALLDTSGGPITTSGNIQLNVDLSELTNATNTALADFMVVIDGETAGQYKIAKSYLPLSHFNIDITTANIAEGANLYFTNTRAIGALTAGDNITVEANGLIVGADQTFTGNTDSVSEGATNLYFTNTRAVDAVTDNISTSNVTEGANLYFTNTRALAAVIDNVNTSNVTEGANLYFTNTRAIGALTAGDNIVIEANGLVIGTATGGNVSLTDTDDLPEGTANLYFTNARVIGSLTAGVGVVIESNGLIVSPVESIYNGTTSVNIPLANGAIVFNVDGETDVMDVNAWGLNVNSNLQITGSMFGNITGTVSSLSNHDTDDLVEGTANLYFTNTRAIGAFTAGDGIDIAANGQIVSTITDTVYANSNLETYLGTVGVDIIPDGNTRNLGESTNVWNNVYAENVIVSGRLTSPSTGVPTIESDTNLNLVANNAVVVTSSPFQLASFTWAQIQDITAANGMMIYNTTNTKVQAYVNGAWVDLHA